MDPNKKGSGNSSNGPRDYRKGNWTLEETMLLIRAKKMDEERRMKRLVGDSNERGKPTELRWKWVEDYCWSHGCLRSQNQCNDKWDNLMRDFKKIRDYEIKVGQEKSYWRIEKNERKENNLPSNMVKQIYEALREVMERKVQTPIALQTSSSPRNLGDRHMPVVQPPPASQMPQTPAERQAPLPFSSQPLPTVDTDASDEYSNSSASKRRKRDVGGGGEGCSSGGVCGLDGVGSAISKSASMIADALHSCEEREEIRHRQVVNLHERRLQIEESKAEVSRQGINGLVDAINKLANAIFSLAARNNNNNNNNSTPPPPPPSPTK